MRKCRRKGRGLVRKHVVGFVKSSARSIVTLARSPAKLVALFGGSVIIENLFAMPGLGQASQTATSSHDFPALIGVVVVATIVVVITNLLLDILVAALDPKVRTA